MSVINFRIYGRLVRCTNVISVLAIEQWPDDAREALACYDSDADERVVALHLYEHAGNTGWLFQHADGFYSCDVGRESICTRSLRDAQRFLAVNWLFGRCLVNRRFAVVRVSSDSQGPWGKDHYWSIAYEGESAPCIEWGFPTEEAAQAQVDVWNDTRCVSSETVYPTDGGNIRRYHGD